jgi:hypothetical protein
MTLTQILQIKERYLKFEDMRALDYCEKRWEQDGRPVKRWELINFIERMLTELKASGVGYPKVLLLRKKEIQRNAFTIEPPRTPEGKREICPTCQGQGWKRQPSTGYVPCECSAGDAPRKQLAAMGIRQ